MSGTSSSSPSSSAEQTLWSPAATIDRAVGASARTSRSSSSSSVGTDKARLPSDGDTTPTLACKSGGNNASALAASECSDFTPQTWTPEELLEMRARERTFDGAYWRTAVGLFGASLIILRVFGMSFFPVGLVFLALGVGFMAIGIARRRRLITCDMHAHGPWFVTSGGIVLLSGAMCLSAYSVLLVLLLRM
ncbi:hypothetical protein H4R26_003677 [Coemansia thaxteri]|uniref:DUF202 domain-containing protein n=1 Tax=Coemansia thaxteri TaxID=2663907 RepID=A0A9W8BCJ5_9FUNG|nr:hypothetical protein H4R26_003677 [Coemansia thaxteri]KAJ2479550.1 hypothetical protein EV174_003987 [Coemansia sp. RSA 2320]